MLRVKFWSQQVRILPSPAEPFCLCLLHGHSRSFVGRLVGNCQRFCQQDGSVLNNSTAIRANSESDDYLLTGISRCAVSSETLQMMRKRYRMFRRGGVFYVQENLSGKQESLHSGNLAEAVCCTPKTRRLASRF